jgi:hypothetical protein
MRKPDPESLEMQSVVDRCVKDDVRLSEFIEGLTTRGYTGEVWIKKPPKGFIHTAISVYLVKTSIDV